MAIFTQFQGADKLKIYTIPRGKRGQSPKFLRAEASPGANFKMKLLPRNHYGVKPHSQTKGLYSTREALPMRREAPIRKGRGLSSSN